MAATPKIFCFLLRKITFFAFSQRSVELTALLADVFHNYFIKKTGSGTTGGYTNLKIVPGDK